MKILKILFLLFLCNCTLKYDNPLDRIIILSNNIKDKSYSLHYLDEDLKVESHFEQSNQLLGASQKGFFRYQDKLINIKENNSQKSIVAHDLTNHNEKNIVKDNALSNYFVYNNLLFFSHNLLDNNSLIIKNLTTKQDVNIALKDYFIDYFLEENQRVYFVASHNKTNNSKLFRIVLNKELKEIYDFNENLDIDNRLLLVDDSIFYTKDRHLIKINNQKKNIYPLKTNNNLLLYDKKKIFLIKKNIIQMDDYSKNLEIFDLKTNESKTMKFNDPIINFEKINDYYYLNTKKVLYQLDTTLKTINELILPLDYVVGLYHFK